MTNEVNALIAEARADASDIRDMEHESYHWVAGLIDNLADALEAATVAPAVDREALARFFDPWAWDYGDPSKGAVQVSRTESLAKADAVIASGFLRDVRDVQAEQRERDAQIADSIGHQENNRYSHIAWEVAQAIRGARSER